MNSTVLAPPAHAPTVAAEVGHYLVALDSLLAGRRFEVAVEPRILGRGPDAPIRIDAADVSRVHCQVRIVDHVLEVEDLASTNGTFVDGVRVLGVRRVGVGSVLRLGQHTFRYEVRARNEVERESERSYELRRANAYVRALLPPPWTAGPVQIDWLLEPSAELGGDALGFHRIDGAHCAIYLVDVSGHGTAAAMHAVSILGAIRNGTPAEALGLQPRALLSHLNARFDMSAHAGLFFSAWYGVYHIPTRTLTYASAGHPPALLIDGDGVVRQLRTASLPIGVERTARFREQSITVPNPARLVVFSDGVYEVSGCDGRWRGLEDFIAIASEAPVPLVPESSRLLSRVRSETGAEGFDDDFSVLVARFA